MTHHSLSWVHPQEMKSVPGRETWAPTFITGSQCKRRAVSWDSLGTALSPFRPMIGHPAPQAARCGAQGSPAGPSVDSYLQGTARGTNMSGQCRWSWHSTELCSDVLGDSKTSQRRCLGEHRDVTVKGPEERISRERLSVTAEPAVRRQTEGGRDKVTSACVCLTHAN